MNFNFGSTDFVSSNTAFDAVTAFCIAKILEVKELYSGSIGEPMSVVLMNGAKLLCTPGEDDKIHIEMAFEGTVSQFILSRGLQQWQIQSAA